MPDTPPIRSESRFERNFQLVFCLLLVALYLRGEARTPFDSGWYVPLAYSLLREGDTDLDEYREVAEADDYRLMEAHGHLYSYFPIGPALIAAPPLWVIKDIGASVYGMSLFYSLRDHGPGNIERLLGSLVVMLTAWLLYRLARRQLAPLPALGVAAAFALGTCAWAVLSRALWQHGPAALCLTLALLALWKKRRPRDFFFAGLALAGGFWMRPTLAVAIVVLSLWVVCHERQHALRFFGGLAVMLLPLFGYYLLTLGQLLPPYYLPGQNGGFTVAGFVEAATGTLFSPGRGLFIYSPILLFAFAGLYLRHRQRTLTDLDIYLAAIVVLHWLLLATRQDWWGGHSYGPRYFADVLPILVLFLIPVFQATRAEASDLATWRRHGLAAALMLFLALSIAIQERGTHWPAWDWNGYPTAIDQDPGRNWDWQDPPFLRSQVCFEHPRR